MKGSFFFFRNMLLINIKMIELEHAFSIPNKLVESLSLIATDIKQEKQAKVIYLPIKEHNTKHEIDLPKENQS